MDFDLNRVNNTLSSIYHRYDNYNEIDLNSFLKQNIPHINDWENRITFGGVYINGIRAKKNCTLPIPAKVEYYEPKYHLEDYFNSVNHWDSDKHIIYEDDFFAVIFKPDNLPTLPPKEQGFVSLWHDLTKSYHQNIHLPSRLDRATSGLLLFSKKESYHKLFQQLFEKKLIQKYYIFESHNNSVWQHNLIKLKITRNPNHQILRTYSETIGVNAETYFSKLTDNLFLAKPLTGRTHQIRVHAASQGLNIIGDNFYNGVEDKELHLLSYAIEFQHPINNQKIKIICPKSLYPEWLSKYIFNHNI